MEALVVHPHVLRELELADEAAADHERGNPALPAIFGSILRKIRTVGGSAPDHAATVHVHRRVPGIHPAAMGAQRGRIAVRIHFFVIEVVVPLRVGAELRIIRLGCQYQRRAAAPPAHELCGDEFPLLGRLPLAAEEFAKRAHVLLQAAVCHETAVAGENLGLRQIGRGAVFIRIAEDELARLQRCAGTRRGHIARPFDDRLREPVTVPEVVVRVAEGWRRLEVERREDLYSFESREQPFVLRLTAALLRRVACEENHDRVQLRTGKPAHPVIGMIRARIAENLRTRRHTLLELLRKSRERRFVHAERAKALPGEGDRYPSLVRFDRRACLLRGRHLVEHRPQPGPPLRGVAEGEEFVSSGEGWRARQENVLDVVEFEHSGSLSITASGRAWWSALP